MLDQLDLAMAEQRIADNEQRITILAVHIQQCQAAGWDTAAAEKMLRLVEEMTDQAHIHRRFVLKVLDRQASLTTD